MECTDHRRIIYKCCIKNCLSVRRKGEKENCSEKFYKFPCKPEIVAQTWLHNCNKHFSDTFTKLKRPTICSLHFTTEQFTSSLRTCLRKYGIPTIFPRTPANVTGLEKQIDSFGACCSLEGASPFKGISSFQDSSSFQGSTQIRTDGVTGLEKQIDSFGTCCSLEGASSFQGASPFKGTSSFQGSSQIRTDAIVTGLEEQIDSFGTFCSFEGDSSFPGTSPFQDSSQIRTDANVTGLEKQIDKFGTCSSLEEASSFQGFRHVRKDNIERPKTADLGVQCNSLDNVAYTAMGVKLQRTSNSLKYYRSKVKKGNSKPPKKDEVLEYCRKELPPITFEIFKAQIKKKKRWNDTLKNLSLLIWFNSAKSYRLLRHIFLLPTIQTLRSYVGNVKIIPGLSKDLLSKIEVASKSLSANDKLVVLLLDEIHLKEGLSLNTKKDLVIGLEDMGNNLRSPMPANSALTVMIRSLTCNWRQPVGYVFSYGPVKSLALKDLLFDILASLKTIGMNVVAITSDQGANFRSLFKSLGVRPDKPFIQHDQSYIAVLPDVPHLLKSTRNAIYSNVLLLPEGGEVHWQVIKDVFDINSLRNFRYIPKVGIDHVDLSKFGVKMRVKLATQILSRSMSVAIKTLVQQQQLCSDALHTSFFCDMMNSLFDILNSSPNERHKSPDHQELRIGSESWELLSEMIIWIKDWKIFNCANKNVTFRFKFISGWLQVINGVQFLLKNLNSKYGLNYIYTRRLNQDALENCFGDIRQCCGLNYSPDCISFENAFRKVATTSIFSITKYRNCEEDGTFNLLNINLCNKAEGNIQLQNFKLSDKKSFQMAKNLKLLPFAATKVGDSVERNGMKYACGFLAKLILRHHKTLKLDCDICNVHDISKNLTEEGLFLSLKQYSHLDCSKGLTASSTEFFLYFVQCELIFCREFKKMYFTSKLIETISNVILSEISYQFCSREMELYTVKKFVCLRVNYSLKFFNKSFLQDRRKREIRRKSKIIVHK